MNNLPDLTTTPPALDELVKAVVRVLKHCGSRDILLIVSDPEGKEHRTFIDCNMQSLATKLGEVMRLNVPDEGKAALVREMFGLNADPVTKRAVMEPGEMVH